MSWDPDQGDSSPVSMSQELVVPKSRSCDHSDPHIGSRPAVALRVPHRAREPPAALGSAGGAGSAGPQWQPCRGLKSGAHCLAGLSPSAGNEHLLWGGAFLQGSPGRVKQAQRPGPVGHERDQGGLCGRPAVEGTNRLLSLPLHRPHRVPTEQGHNGTSSRVGAQATWPHPWLCKDCSCGCQPHAAMQRERQWSLLSVDTRLLPEKT